MTAGNDKIGRNDPCPCGSGLKHKRCCLNSSQAFNSPSFPELRDRWDREEIARMTTGQIFEMLARLGIPSTEDAFLKDAAECRGSSDICRRWEAGFKITAEGNDADFPWMAADVLWRRLVPDKISTEQLDDMMQEGYELIAKRDLVAGCTLWLLVWAQLKGRFTPEMRDIHKAESVFSGAQYLSNWVQDLEMELGNAARQDMDFNEQRIRVCREFCRYFPESHSIANTMMRAIAEALFRSGREEEAEKELQALVEAYPRIPWGFVTWGDNYAGFFGKTIDPIKAEARYRQGLGLDPREDGIILDRIRSLKEGKKGH
jgi:hypothetical protein